MESEETKGLLRSQIWGKKTLVWSLIIIIVMSLVAYFSGVADQYQNHKPTTERTGS